ncbi:MAG TPA: MerR family transcriptional regulator [Methylomirabilota bacterium]|nr:MerR family transcriptional regulator [Methylomirabilota bacterium]
MDKAPDAFRTISEVAEDLDLPQHVLRFWETRFSQIRPMKRGGGRRYYRPDDVELLRGIRHLLYGEGFTIKGVQRILKEQGVRFVMDIWRNPGAPIPNGKASPALAAAAAKNAAEAAEATAFHPPDAGEEHGAFAADPSDEVMHGGQPESPHGYSADFSADEPLPNGILPDGAPGRSGLRFIDRLRGASEPAGNSGLSKDDIRRLQATLFELLECKRLLDQTR